MPIAVLKPTDPLYTSQWHLAMIGRLGFAGGNNTTGLERVWASYTGTNVRVGIWDTGVQATQWDLSANFFSSLLVTVNGQVNSGQPLTATDIHGTAVAGLIAADNNGVGGVGVAFDSSITGVTIFGGPDDINLNWDRYLLTLDALQNFDVTNHSYGAVPNFYTAADVQKFHNAAVFGRGGLGTITVKSAGNYDANGNGDGLDASQHSVTVAAIEADGYIASYSTYGAHILVSAPAGSVTTDVTGLGVGYDGLLNGDYTNVFGGTSAAAPIVTGVVALILDANPLLGWRDVHAILSLSAIGTGSIYGGPANTEHFGWRWNKASNWNGGGLHYSEDYGYGMVNAYNAVRMAEVWSLFFPQAQTSANELSLSTGVISANQAMVDAGTLTYNFSVAQNMSLEHVSLGLNFTHANLTQLRIQLVSPSGTSMNIYNGTTGTAATSDLGLSYAFGLDGLRGEQMAGTWSLRIQDTTLGETGTLNSVELTGFGAAVSVNDVYHYTDEVLTLQAQAGQSTRVNLIDTNGGMDWINAATLYQDLVLDLNAGSNSTLGGIRFITIAVGTLIENAVTGDGNDRINGNALDNQLLGMQGDDVLYGALGNDTLDGGAGLDWAVFQGLSTAYVITTLNGKTLVTGADGTDWLTGIEYLAFSDKNLLDPTADIATPAPPATGPGTGTVSPPPPPQPPSGGNVITGTAAADNLIGTAQADVIDGLAGNDTLSGGDGNDTLIGGAGNDRFSGGAGIDTISYLGTTAAVTFSLASTANQNTRGSGTDALLAGHSIENLTGGSAADTLTGDANANQIDGAAGNDTLNGGLGADTLMGGLGKDVFVFNSKLGAGNIDTLVNYNVVDDTIRLENTGIFSALTKTGALAATAFTAGSSATTAAHRIIYTASSGALLYDADGTGSVAPVQFATLQSVSGTLTSADFVVI